MAFAAVFVVLHFAHVDTLSLTRDPSATTGVGPQVGIISTLGLILWGAAAAVLALAATLVETGSDAAFFACTAGALGLLLVDDALLLHEKILPDAGIPQDLVYAVYVIGAVAWLFAFRRQIADSRVILLALGGAGFAASIGLDVLDARQSVEDYAKYVGIATIFAWAFDEARRHLRPAVPPRPSWLSAGREETADRFGRHEQRLGVRAE
jgi:hypothetical protein